MVSPLAVAAASAAVIAVGFAWYSPLAFGPLWLKHVGVSEAAMKKNMPWGMALGMGASVLQVVFLSLLLLLLPVGSVGDAAKVGVILWATFPLPLALGKVAWECKPWPVFFVNAGYDLVNAVLAAVILTALS